MAAQLIPMDGPKLEADLQAVLNDVRALVAERDSLAERLRLSKERFTAHKATRLGWMEAANFLETLGQFSYARALRREAGVVDGE